MGKKTVKINNKNYEVYKVWGTPSIKKDGTIEGLRMNNKLLLNLNNTLLKYKNHRIKLLIVIRYAPEGEQCEDY